MDDVLLAVWGEQLFGAELAAQRPEAGASSAGEDYGIEVRFGHKTLLG
jgi:hypothetical protein